MTNQDNLTEDTLSDAAHVDAADGSKAVADTLSLAELNQYLGKDFKDKATAFKAVKDTFSYVGKKTETPQQTASDPDLKAKVQSLEEEIFYANHPEYREQRELIKQFGKAPAEVVAMDAFKNVFEKVKVADEVSKRQSVVTSNSRIGQTSSSLDAAVKAANAGRTDEMKNALSAEIVEQYGLTG